MASCKGLPVRSLQRGTGPNFGRVSDVCHSGRC